MKNNSAKADQLINENINALFNLRLNDLIKYVESVKKIEDKYVESICEIEDTKSIKNGYFTVIPYLIGEKVRITYIDIKNKINKVTLVGVVTGVRIYENEFHSFRFIVINDEFSFCVHLLMAFEIEIM